MELFYWGSRSERELSRSIQVSGALDHVPHLVLDTNSFIILFWCQALFPCQPGSRSLPTPLRADYWLLVDNHLPREPVVLQSHGPCDCWPESRPGLPACVARGCTGGGLSLPATSSPSCRSAHLRPRSSAMKCQDSDNAVDTANETCP